MTARPAFVGIEHDLKRYAFGAGWKDPFARCSYCHDPCRDGWTLCDRCHAVVYWDSPAARAYWKRRSRNELKHALDTRLRRIELRLRAHSDALWRIGAQVNAVEDGRVAP